MDDQAGREYMSRLRNRDLASSSGSKEDQGAMVG